LGGRDVTALQRESALHVEPDRTDEEIEGYISNMVELAQLCGIKGSSLLFHLQRISFGILG
jgi:hypothetical protein